jgi:hypothetical protein
LRGTTGAGSSIFAFSPKKMLLAPKEFSGQADEVGVTTIGLAPQAMSPDEDHRMARMPKNFQGGKRYGSHH